MEPRFVWTEDYEGSKEKPSQEIYGRVPECLFHIGFQVQVQRAVPLVEFLLIKSPKVLIEEIECENGCTNQLSTE